MTSFSQAWRSLLRRRASTVAIVLTLTAGIAITTTTFSIVNAAIFRPLPYPDGAQLVAVYEFTPAHRERFSLIAPARLEDWNRLNRTFTAISGSYGENVTDTSGAEPERLDGRRVVPRFFEAFGMPPLAGRTFVPDEERFGGAGAAVISETFWSRRFSRSPAAIGSRLIVAGSGYTIVGVMPRAFSTAATDVWLPAQLAPGLMAVREARFLVGVGRMRPGVTLAEAQTDLTRVQAVLEGQYPASDKGWSAAVRDLKDVRTGEYRRPLMLVFGAVGLLFAIAVANVAGLVLGQLHRRAPEFAVRSAIGGSRRQIVAAVMREVLLLAIAGAAGGAALTFWLSSSSAAAFPGIPRLAETDVDGRVLAFVVLSTAAAALVFGLLPALFATRARIAVTLSSGGRAVSAGPHRLQAVIVVVQLTLGVVLAGTAGLLVRSYGALTAVDSGFEAAHVLTFHVGAAWDEDRVRVGRLQQRLIADLQRLPGVRAAGYANFLPGTGATLRARVTVAGLSGLDGDGAFTTGQRTVTPGYLKALSIPLVSGQLCEEVPPGVPAGRPADAMVNRRFVDQYASGQDLVGGSLSFSQQGGASFRIVGIVGDVREDRPATPVVPYVYTCLSAGSWPDPEYVVRADGDPRVLAGSIRRLVQSLDSSRPVFGLKPLGDLVAAALDQPRLNASALGVFAAAALALAAVGLYGLLRLLVEQRRRELGVRMALGASPLDLVRLVVAGAGRLVVAGMVSGVVLTVLSGYLLRTLLFGVSPYDPGAIGAGVLALAVVAVVALIVPARHAAAASGMDAMRVD